MNGIKIIKKLDYPEYLEILEQTDFAKISETEKQLIGVIDDLPTDYFLDAVKAGEMSCTDICYNGESFYRIFWQRNRDVLHVCVSRAITNRSNVAAWTGGVEKIARANGCRKITFSTARLAHIEIAKKWGARVTGLTMEFTMS